MIVIVVVLLLTLYVIAKWSQHEEEKAKHKPKRRRTQITYDSDGVEYESPLGLVDNPDDEWIEWAMMDDILDGPDEGLF